MEKGKGSRRASYKKAKKTKNQNPAPAQAGKPAAAKLREGQGIQFIQPKITLRTRRNLCDSLGFSLGNFYQTILER
jgi:hypothetical protein